MTGTDSTMIPGALALLLALALAGCTPSEEAAQAVETSQSEPADEAPAAAQQYVCPMHPQVRRGEPDVCPICEMDLVPVESGNDAASEIALQPSERAVALMDIGTTEVTRLAGASSLTLRGEVVVAEDSETQITAWTDGRVERVYVDAVGEHVRAGQPVVALYSPDVAVAAAELERSTATAGGEAGAPPSARLRAAASQAARERLLQAGLTPAQVDEVARNGLSNGTFPVAARTSGTVLSREVRVGQWVARGDVLMDVASLRSVWIELELRGGQLERVRVGDKAEIRVPGRAEPIPGEVSFVDPVVDPRTRVGTARLVLDNADLGLRPGVWVEATMLPPGAEADTQDAASGRESRSVVSVPSSAVLWTGERSIVYVYDSSVSPAVYMPIEVETGERQGGHVEIRSGVFPGERVVTRGAFRLDASLQIQGGDSMMSGSRHGSSSGAAGDAGEHGGHEHGGGHVH